MLLFSAISFLVLFDAISSLFCTRSLEQMDGWMDGWMDDSFLVSFSVSALISHSLVSVLALVALCSGLINRYGSTIYSFEPPGLLVARNHLWANIVIVVCDCCSCVKTRRWSMFSRWSWNASQPKRLYHASLLCRLSYFRRFSPMCLPS